MREWAFATSPHGLGLSDGGWSFTPREFRALADVHQQYGTHRADFFNAHFRGKDTAAFLAGDFVSNGDREKRTQDEQLEKLKVMRANTQLAQIKRGDPPPEGVAELFGL